jgi:hypothetical protein
MKRKVDWFRVAIILALGAAVVWVSIILGRSPIGIALGGDLDATWTAPTKNCDGTALTNLAGYRVRWGKALDELPMTQLSYRATGLTPGFWWFSIAAYNTQGVESQFVSGGKTVKPEEFVTTTTKVYTFAKAEGNILVLPTLHTVPLGTQCDANQSVNGKYIIPRSAVTWSGSARPVAVLGDCG